MLRAVKPVDPTVEAFLKKGNPNGEIRTLEGFSTPEEKHRDAQHKYLIAEACTYGDALIAYVAAHNKISPQQRVWGLSLAILCQRGDFPEGGERFDEYADAGGADLKLDVTTEIKDPQKAETYLLALNPFTDAEQNAAARFAEEIATYIAKKKQTTGINNLQTVYGIGRAFHTLRLQFPLDLGGTAVFDELARRAGSYYFKNK